MSQSLEQTLAAVLQAEVDKRVAAVQAAADAWVEAFRQQAEGIARGEIGVLQHTNGPLCAPVLAQVQGAKPGCGDGMLGGEIACGEPWRGEVRYCPKCKPSAPAVEPPETMPAHMQPPPGTEDDTPPTWVVTDNAAMAANMRTR